jgi:cysteine desulfuration protein SufE
MLISLEDLVENFTLFDDWEGRYQYLIDLGGKLPLMNDALKVEANEVKGCVSRVWLFAEKLADGRWTIQADSDGNITKGLVYIVLSAYEGRTDMEISRINIDAAFAQMGLAEHLTPNRRNGFYAMVEKIKALSV